MKFSVNNHLFEAKLNRFPAGEIGVVLPKANTMPVYAGNVNIWYDWTSYKNDGLIVLAQLVQTLRDKYKNNAATKLVIRLVLPYVPYSRQDRVCNSGESLSLKVFAEMINAMNFDVVETWDNHSDVATALINNCLNISQTSILGNRPVTLKMGVTLVSPDNGAMKKVRDIAKSLVGFNSIVRCDKNRDVTTGKILSTEVFDKKVVEENGRFLVVDDICEGGATFIGVGQAIKEIKPNAQLSLYVTHGFFSAGLDKLLEIYDYIYTTNSVCRIEHPNLHIIKEVEL